jgi:hypothetical protein
MENKSSNTSLTEKSTINIDPETGKVSYGNYHSLIKLFNEFLSYYKNTFLKDKKVMNEKDPKFLEIYKGARYLYGQFTKNLETNHPEEYSNIEPIIDKQIRENLVKNLVRKALEEMSATGAGASAATFTPGESANYAPKFAYNPNKKAKGAQNIYYYKLGWKPVDAEKLHKQAKGIEHKDLWKKKLEETEESSDSYIESLKLSNPKLKEFIGTKVNEFEIIEDKLNTLLPLLKRAKAETMEYYKYSPDFQIKYSTDVTIDYLDDLITLFKDKK